MIQGIEPCKVVEVLTELCKLVMRPPNQLSAVNPMSHDYFRSQWIVNAQFGPIF